MNSFSKLVTMFADGQTKGTASSSYIKGKELHSEFNTRAGHVILAVRTKDGVLMNADTSWGDLAKQQAKLAKSGHVFAQVSFLALASALIKPGKLRMVDNSSEIIREFYHLRNEKDMSIGNINLEEFEALPQETTNKYVFITERTPQTTLFRVHHRSYLNGEDNPGGERWRARGSYFFIELNNAPRTIAEAIELLRPLELRSTMEKTMVEGKDFYRQGEWFFVPIDKATEPTDFRAVYIGGEKKHARVPKYEYQDFVRLPEFVLPNLDRGNPHTAGHGIMDKGIPYVTGTIRHSQHGTLTLPGETIYRACHNTAAASFAQAGAID